MTTKRKVRRPKASRNLGAWIEHCSGKIRLGAYAYPSGEAKRLIKWLERAVLYLEQQKEK